MKVLLTAKWIDNPKQHWAGWLARFKIEGESWSFIGAPHATKAEAIDAARAALAKNYHGEISTPRL